MTTLWDRHQNGKKKNPAVEPTDTQMTTPDRHKTTVHYSTQNLPKTYQKRDKPPYISLPRCTIQGGRGLVTSSYQRRKPLINALQDLKTALQAHTTALKARAQTPYKRL